MSAIYAFFKAITIYPEVAAVAQAEIDSVVGADRFPSFSDRNNLPFVNALVLEVLRWHSVVPLGMLFPSPLGYNALKLISEQGVPHVVMEDDIHEGYFIPKGSLVIANIWFVHSPSLMAVNLKSPFHIFIGECSTTRKCIQTQ